MFISKLEFKGHKQTLNRSTKNLFIFYKYRLLCLWLWEEAHGGWKCCLSYVSRHENHLFSLGEWSRKKWTVWTPLILMRAPRPAGLACLWDSSCTCFLWSLSSCHTNLLFLHSLLLPHPPPGGFICCFLCLDCSVSRASHDWLFHVVQVHLKRHFLREAFLNYPVKMSHTVPASL